MVDFSRYNRVDLPGFDLAGLSDLALSCVVMAMDMSDNGLSWAPAEDVLSLLSQLNEEGSNVNDVAFRIADLANWFN